MARALIPSFLNTLIPTSNSLLNSKLATTVVKLTIDLFDKLERWIKGSLDYSQEMHIIKHFSIHKHSSI